MWNLSGLINLKQEKNHKMPPKPKNKLKKPPPKIQKVETVDLWVLNCHLTLRQGSHCCPSDAWLEECTLKLRLQKKIHEHIAGFFRKCCEIINVCGRERLSSRGGTVQNGLDLVLIWKICMKLISNNNILVLNSILSFAPTLTSESHSCVNFSLNSHSFQIFLIIHKYSYLDDQCRKPNSEI